MEFLKSNIDPEWMDLVEEFPEFILELSPTVLSVIDNFSKLGDNISSESLTPEKFCNLRYGFECSIGWKELLREYFEDIQALIEKSKRNGDEVFYKTCIMKEKFGELRDQGDFYGKDCKKYWKEYSDLSHKLAEKSLLQCEICGMIGELKKRGYWVKTLCEKHAEEREYKKAYY